MDLQPDLDELKAREKPKILKELNDGNIFTKKKFR